MNKFDKRLDRCVICKCRDIYHYHTVSDNNRIFRCRKCGIQFMNPQYSDEHLAGYYAAYTSDEPQWEEPLLYCHDYYLSIIEKHINKGTLLDIGSGKGYLLEAGKKRGWKVEGYDVDKEWNEKLSRKMNVNIKSGNFLEQVWDKKFDVITLHHVLEHLKDPVSYIEKIYGMLADGGILFITLPNINSRSALFKRRLEKAGIRKKNIGAYYDTSHHLIYFTPATLGKLFRSKGFEVIKTKSGHAARPGQSDFKRFYLRNFSDWIIWKSTFLMIGRKRIKSV
jgi:2-polyprenyl-3-methyl-5-hydroxy-6-metoxy-1,4-benzoquinol methylase